MPSKRIFSCLLLALGLSLLASPATVDAAPIEATSEILKMLSAEVSEKVIIQWLESGHHAEQRIDPETIIELQNAGASDELLQRILELVVPDEHGDIGTDIESPELSPAMRPLNVENIGLTLSVDYRPDFDEDDEIWDLYIYLDGQPVSFSSGSRPWLFAKVSRQQIVLTPGRHTLRMTQERHDPRNMRKLRWRHESRVSPLELELELEAGQVRDLEVSFIQPRFGFGGAQQMSTITFSHAQNVIAELSDETPVESWPMVCEDVHANQTRNGDVPRSMQWQLEQCASWSSLWPLEAEGISPVLERSEILAQIEGSKPESEQPSSGDDKS